MSRSTNYAHALKSSMLVMDGLKVVWKDFFGLTIQSFDHPHALTAPLSACFCAFNQHFHIAILVHSTLLRVHDVSSGDSQDFHLSVPIKSIFYMEALESLIMQSDEKKQQLLESRNILYTFSYPSMKLTPVHLLSNQNPEEEKEDFLSLFLPSCTIGCTAGSLLCIYDEHYLRILKLDKVKPRASFEMSRTLDSFSIEEKSFFGDRKSPLNLII